MTVLIKRGAQIKYVVKLIFKDDRLYRTAKYLIERARIKAVKEVEVQEGRLLNCLLEKKGWGGSFRALLAAAALRDARGWGLRGWKKHIFFSYNKCRKRKMLTINKTVRRGQVRSSSYTDVMMRSTFAKKMLKHSMWNKKTQTAISSAVKMLYGRIQRMTLSRSRTTAI